MIDRGRWYAVAASHDLVPGHIYRTVLGGHELALWRSDDGAAHVWEDRCPHRGVRLSLGEVAGNELRCQYHAWRFGPDGACRFIPAQPGMKVPGSIRATTWPAREHGGLVWSGLPPEGDPPALPDGAPIRAIPVRRPVATLAAALADAPTSLHLLAQPLDAETTMLRGLALDGDLVAADQAMLALVRRLEAA